MNIVVLGKIGDINYPSDRIYQPTAGPGEFLSITSRAAMVITDSYHGMLFAINYHKKFWSVERAYTQYDQSSRQLTVLTRLGLEERYIKSSFNFTDMEINYEKIQDKIDDFVKFSMEYLNISLEK
ncbi:MAG: polysaccharide pyruvyl transferase family protein [Bacteroidaceae bacterium]|nr:polysaccharide pyruvyl transferase family protein [Bacteroidaceae bacterium]